MKNTLFLIVSVFISYSTFASEFALTSDSVANGKPISKAFFTNQFGCSGENKMPDLKWENAPENTKSFALSYFDLDAPTGSGFWHYTLFNIDGNIDHLAGGIDGGKLPKGSVQGRTDLGIPGFIGSCPQTGEIHRYQWKLTALDVDKLDIGSDTTPQVLSLNLLAHSLGQAKLTVLAGR
ncbi:YbhB/YbcL family Raf kinase inhibitor-like protein [Vibrio mediterranei]|uniref:YbhB/YbcL family Raf kinase inhibitor-like protein n=1 Tax=Vibrio mediterranei TaxID=689 RepID=UPI001EFC51EA|nr:YbhB/YbcL family Raf kinase inhibitor-like protein [Vibrio mediterranei]MCG9627732.1 YbhB/YbcL family Raf kinase inhibitor-like protein [Vibrio mediterranei]